MDYMTAAQHQNYGLPQGGTSMGADARKQQAAYFEGREQLPQAPQSALELALGGVDTVIHEVGNAVRQLEERLASVLQPDMPRVAADRAGTAIPEQPHSGVVNMLHDYRSRLESLTNTVNHIRSRLET